MFTGTWADLKLNNLSALYISDGAYTEIPSGDIFEIFFKLPIVFYY